MTGVPPSTESEYIHSRYRADRNVMLYVLALGIVVQGLLTWIIWQPDAAGAPLMLFEAAEPVGTQAVCPGESLRYTLTLHVDGPGVFDLDVGVWRVEPPAMVVFSMTRRLVFAEATTYTIDRAWVVPLTYTDPATGRVGMWQPGRYERRHAISTSSRATLPSFATFPFTIRDNCP